jgi:hypothetical protein
MRSTALVLCLLATAACSKKEDAPPAPTPTPAPTPSDKPATPSAPPTTPPAAKRLYTLMSCEKVLAAAIRDKYFAGLTPADVTNESNSGECKFDGKAGPLKFGAACLDAAPEGTYQMLVDSAKKRAANGFKTVEGVGKFVTYTGVGNSSVEGGNHTIIVYDDDSECEIRAIIPAKVDVATFAKDAIAAFPIK